MYTYTGCLVITLALHNIPHTEYMICLMNVSISQIYNIYSGTYRLTVIITQES